MNTQSFKGFHLGGSRVFKFILELCVCIKYLKLGEPGCSGKLKLDTEGCNLGQW